MKIADERRVEWLEPGALKPTARNARTHSRKQILQIARSMDRFGFTSPILIDEYDGVLAGHGRLEAAKERGMETVPCLRVSNLSDAQKRAYLIADNKLAQNAGWDLEILAGELGSLIELDFDVCVTGFEEAEVDLLLDAAAEASPRPAGPEDEHPEPPPPESAVTRPCDQWLLGRHALICGDAKDPEVLARLMDGRHADMVFTDPPYNVPISGHVSGLGRTRHREFAEASGEMSPAEFTAFLRASFENLERACKNGAIVFTCMDWRHLREAIAAGDAVFTELKNLCVWRKSNGGMGAFYRSQHEMVLVWKVGDLAHTNNFGLGDKGRYRTNVWAYPGVNSFRAGRMEELALHPTVKPVALVADAIRDVSNRGQVVLDLFGGSGTTLIAAEKTGRLARLLEIDPGYCDVIVRRWERLTGKEATLTETGETFEAVEARRASEATSSEVSAS